jgi:site-specific DNA-methyltransferase (adenine-specific)
MKKKQIVNTPQHNIIFNEDCLEGMKSLPDNSIDMILCDLPYGTTQCKWDSIIPFDKLWEQFHRVIKKNGVMALTASQPFTSFVVRSNVKNFKYSWIWEKSKATGYLNAKKRPMNAHEDVLIFSKGTPRYFPQMTNGEPYNKGKAHRPTDVYGKQKSVLVEDKKGIRYPRSVQYFKTAESEGEVIHPTQKPISLFEYLIRTYSLENEIILDACMGSGSTAIACINTNRKYIGYELDTKYYNDSLTRISNSAKDKK